jgi:hypothetical protein|tara:strand:- start:68 stop:469 length:402 start_codon:yes stop_codon:yes gene_type:complete
MNRKVMLLLLLICTPAMGNNSLSLQLPTGSSNYQSDKFKTGDLDCSNAIGGTINLEFGVTGIINNATSIFSTASDVPKSKDIGVFARIIMPLNAPKERINCNTLYLLELGKKRLEIMKLETELNALRRLQLGE